MTPVTNRQREVAELKAQGLIDIEIANRLGIARSTVRSHYTPKHMSRRNGQGQGWRGSHEKAARSISL